MARCTSSSAGGCIAVLNLPVLALYRTAPDNPDAMSRPAGVYCRVLGPVQVTVAGADAPPELLWRKHVALLVYLARSPRRRRTREHLVGLLWSDRDEKQARHSLSRSEEHTSELQSQSNLVCRLLLEKKKHVYAMLQPADTALLVLGIDRDRGELSCERDICRRWVHGRRHHTFAQNARATVALKLYV